MSKPLPKMLVVKGGGERWLGSLVLRGGLGGKRRSTASRNPGQL
jgi:hypothetical protein